ncbi:P-loop containing nucleoside triphosphate hydrolase protein [Eremomyces bilateralis CBS 781.70]|uniref:P-loop containing nucleoside triphosphate hydrolase protein n=1 Tax=Eremomyces bilateralis CBS 781.70 TaxID=1392243 RepID=A0A6G1FQ01_9PEZI|nr:P-loop containing nucleoside triphosphate hydrolase protein [Eremomyces bilateralis CBS 781.70]XP_033529474.1 P-loop containing nucleoside triphosphate hydrolase protein [Eremomyces bilateralis CBS 781.70]KAF1807836.1 P-loop containing nucleoside triphosphate hydrolase protein [Eremomyces bilateralis CBS 781.70]KAF1807843.1 P-loop containing nucleoside triphosphate hydrolase protein [Eremomyces bilateralis CBS 781.70]
MNGDVEFVPSPLQALICPAWSPGYSLSEKEWAYFDIKRAKAIDWKEDPIQELQLDDNERQILVDVVTEHLENGAFRDVVGEKGQGLIILLYGPPGCGKTLTAVELIAEQKRRPLLRISCGDLGEDAWRTDRELHNLLKLALKCSAVVLIDEADVFLSKRAETGTGNYDHNGLVAVFLKHLEYFPGVMFLTSNRKDEFDDAAESRIHIRLQYEALDVDRQANIWKSHLKGSHVPEDWDLDVCRELARKYDINGREIKNLVHVSTAICRQRNRKLSISDIEQVYALRRKPTSKPIQV